MEPSPLGLAHAYIHFFFLYVPLCTFMQPWHLDLEDPLHPQAVYGLLELLQELVLERRVRMVLIGEDAQLEVVRRAALEGSV